MRPPLLTALLACVSVTLATTGCSSLHLYNSVRDTQGQAARKAWSEVNLQATIDAERANLDKLLAAEIETQQQLATAIRDHTLAAMVRSKSVTEGLRAPLEARLTALAGNPDAIVQARDRLVEQKAASIFSDNRKEDLRNLGLAVPTCKQIGNNAVPAYIADWRKKQKNENVKAIVNAALRELREACNTNLSEDLVYAGFGGALRTAWNEYKNEQKQLDEVRATQAKLESNYTEARKAYEDAVSKASSNAHLSADVRAAADRLNDAIKALRDASNPYADKLLAQESLQSIADLAQLITETQPGQAPPPDSGAAARAFIVLPQLHDDLQAALANARKPLALPLLIRRNYEQLKLEAAKRDIAAREQLVELSHELVTVLYHQAQQLLLARNEVDQAKALHEQAFLDAYTSGNRDQREALYAAAARYLDAINRLDAQRYALEYRRVAVRYERSLAYAEVNAKQWQSLIDTSVNQVADYSAGGFKPEQIANYLNTLGLLSIGVGVNR